MGTARSAVTTSSGHPERGLPSGTVTLLFTDMEGSTRLVERLGARFAEVLADHLAVLRRSVVAHEGHEVGVEGDSLFAVFPRAEDAVRAAVEAQRALRTYPWPPGVEVRVRMGLHTGTPEHGADTYVGYDVHRAARIAGVAHGGQVLLSGTTRALLDPLPAGLGAVDLGRHRLKDLAAAEHLFQLSGAGLAAQFPPLRSQEAVPTNLPRERTSFVGRESELDELAQLLREHRLLTLTGEGGTGKTRLGIRLARRVLEEFPGGVWLVRLTEIGDPDLVGTAVTAAMGLADHADRDPVSAVAEYTRGQRHLLLIDNFEHVITAAPTVAELLDQAPGVSVVVTSREVLHLDGEHAYAVSPLDLPAPGAAPSVGQVAQVDSVRLFVERARAVRPDFTVTEADVPAVVEVAQRLEGLPLAIELAAARVSVLSLQELAARLERRLGVLTSGARDLPPRQRTLRSTIAWSYELLAAPEQQLLQRLSVFAAPVDLATVEEVCGAEGGEVLDTLAALVDKSLVRRVPSPEGRSRFWMLESVKEFVREVADDLTRERDAHARHYEAFARALAARLFGPEQATWLERAEDEAADVAAAIGWCLERGDGDRAARITVGAHGYWWLRAQFGSGRHWVRRVLAAGTSDALLHGWLLVVGARLGAEQAAFDAARSDLSEAERLAREHGDEALLAQALSEQVALDARLPGRLQVSRAEEALAAFRRRGDHVGEGELLIRIGGVHAGLQQPEEARTRFERALELLHAAGNSWGEASALNNLGFLAAEEGRFEAAEHLMQRSLAVFERLRTPEGLGSVLDSLAAVRIGQRRLADAVPLLERALAIQRELGYHPGIRIALVQLAWCRAHLGDPEAATGEALEAIELARTQGDEAGLGATETAVAVLAASGRTAVAASLLATCDRVREQRGLRLLPLDAGRVAVDRAALAGEPERTSLDRARGVEGAPTVEEALDLAARELRRAHPAW